MKLKINTVHVRVYKMRGEKETDDDNPTCGC